ncbi:hypothetical protein LJB85_04115 [Porphyromonadaceae bacterium OttesenSCG-928-L07]|nr:hypothetical protein [Porphyromonadaceae bacterium OttesenSCG-928-L07]
MKKPHILSFILLFILFFSSCSKKEPDWQQEHLEAFAKVYGLVRWFHPSDEAQEVNWEKFAAYGVSQIAGCKTPEQFAGKLEELFRPIAPGISFSDKDQYQDVALITPPDTIGMSPVSWQHYGVDLGVWSNRYVSKRTNRPLHTQAINKAAIMGWIPAAYFPNGDLNVSVKIRKLTPSEDFKIFFKTVITPFTSYDDRMGFCVADSTLEPIQNSGEWQTYSYKLKIDESNRDYLITTGVYANGEGKFSLEHIEFNGKKGYEMGHKYTQQLSVAYDYGRRYDSWRFDVSTKEKLFDEHAIFGEVTSHQLMKDFYVHVPLALYGNKERTWPYGNKDNLTRLQKNIHAKQFSDKELMLADIVLAWNAIEYFSPYLADVETDWKQQLTDALAKALTIQGYNHTPLAVMMAQLEDGHVGINAPGAPPFEDWRWIPASIKKSDGKIMITSSFDSLLQAGDLIVSVDGKDALDTYSFLEEGASGGKHYKAARAARAMQQHWLHSFGEQQKGPSEKAKMRIIRNGKEKNVMVSLVSYDKYSQHYMARDSQPSRWLTPNVLYLNLMNTKFDEIKSLLADRTKEQTVIVDIRKGVISNLWSLYPLLFGDNKFASTRMGTSVIPKIIYPETPVITDTLSDIPPPTPDKRNIFLVGPFNLSNHEDFLDHVRYEGLGYFIGTNTGGCNGAINKIYLSSGGWVAFTGMKVLSNLGKSSYYYSVGIPPHLYVENSMKDIIEGRDAALELAISLNK